MKSKIFFYDENDNECSIKNAKTFRKIILGDNNILTEETSGIVKS